MAVKRCPRCGSNQVQFMNQDRKSFNGLVGCIGFLIAWPLILLGLVGKKGKNNWHCQSCGNTFKTK
ncbi:hypothetical protein ACHBIE_04615 [Streptococcus sp. A23]|uniref:hypothetical protein n=1 Tax=Streptococcus sp. A23 TaxID=3373127 RepID=UPI00374C8C2B